MAGRRARNRDDDDGDEGQAIFTPWRPGEASSGVEVPEASKRAFILLLALPALLQIAAIATYNPSADELREEQERRAMRLRGGTLAAPTGARHRRRRRDENEPGRFYVDSSCIDCDTCRWMAPGTYGRAEGASYVKRQPRTDGEVADALAAVVACPTGSIRLETPEPRVRDVRFPRPIDASLPHVYHLGYHCAASFGATPYLLHAPHGAAGAPLTAMVDSPRYNSALARSIEFAGMSPQLMLLTHMDDVGEMSRWNERFPDLERVMHAADVRSAEQWPYVEMRCVERILHGDGPWELAPGLRAIHTPGHSRGSLCFLAEASLTGGGGVLFSGDHLAYSARLKRIDGMGRYGWNLPLQARSIAKLAAEPFLWLLPGHARRVRFVDADERAARIEAAASAFAADPLGARLDGGETGGTQWSADGLVA